MTLWRPSRPRLWCVIAAAAMAAVGTVASARPTRYTPRIEPSTFSATVDNPYFDLRPGTRRVYRAVDRQGGVTRHVVEATAETRRVMGVMCAVVRATVASGGRVVKDGVDWYAQDAAGNVWYFGEQVTMYEDGKVAHTDGSWEAGVGGAQPGIVMQARPQVGQRYREEYHRGVAEDSAEVVSLDQRAKVPVGTFAGLLMTRDTTPLEPDLVEHRHYAEGVGLVLVTTMRGAGGRTELIELTRR